VNGQDCALRYPRAGLPRSSPVEPRAGDDVTGPGRCGPGAAGRFHFGAHCPAIHKNPRLARRDPTTPGRPRPTNGSAKPTPPPGAANRKVPSGPPAGPATANQGPPRHGRKQAGAPRRFTCATHPGPGRLRPDRGGNPGPGGSLPVRGRNGIWGPAGAPHGPSRTPEQPWFELHPERLRSKPEPRGPAL